MDTNATKTQYLKLNYFGDKQEFFASHQLGDDQAHTRRDVHVFIQDVNGNTEMRMRIDGAKRIDGSSHIWSFDAFLMPPHGPGVKIRGYIITPNGQLQAVVILQERLCSNPAKTRRDCKERQWVHPDKEFCPDCGHHMALMQDPATSFSWK